MSENDMVIHCAAALPLYSEEEIVSIDVEGTRNLLAAAHRHGIGRFVFISSTSVYGVPDHHPLVEEDELVGVGPYGQAKIDAEVSRTNIGRKTQVLYQRYSNPNPLSAP
jgi:nucleoside-diphosphate-sugar epimerase